MKTDHVLDVSRLEGIVEYEPAELVLTARPGRAARLDQRRACEKPADAGLRAAGLARAARRGGRADAGRRDRLQLAGSRRVRAGSARDYVLGFSAVNGFGEIWKAGGKVVKNVTGYDMCKLQAGAYGTLSALTEITLKVMPKPETACTIVLHGLADEARDLRRWRMRSIRRSRFPARRICPASRSAPFEGRRCGGGPRRGDGAAAGRPTAVGRLSRPRARIVGRARRASQRERRRRRSGRKSAPFSPFSHQDRASSGGSVRRQAGRPSVAHSILSAMQSAEFYFDWGGGLIWLSLDPEEAGPDAGANIVRPAVEIGGRPRHPGRGAGNRSRRDAGVRALERRARRADRAGEEGI